MITEIWGARPDRATFSKKIRPKPSERRGALLQPRARRLEEADQRDPRSRGCGEAPARSPPPRRPRPSRPRSRSPGHSPTIGRPPTRPRTPRHAGPRRRSRRARAAPRCRGRTATQSLHGGMRSGCDDCEPRCHGRPRRQRGRNSCLTRDVRLPQRTRPAPLTRGSQRHISVGRSRGQRGLHLWATLARVRLTTPAAGPKSLQSPYSGRLPRWIPGPRRGTACSNLSCRAPWVCADAADRSPAAAPGRWASSTSSSPADPAEGLCAGGAAVRARPRAQRGAGRRRRRSRRC